MKNQLIGLLMLISIAVAGQKPLTRNDGNFPSTIYHVYESDNSWMKPGASIFSAFMIEGKLYASGENIIGGNQVDAMAFHNTGSDAPYQLAFDVIVQGLAKEPVKTGLDFNEVVYWGLWDGAVMKQLILKSTYTSRAGETAIFELTDVVLEIMDNPYWSINPVWPSDTTLKIKTPTATNRQFYLYNLAYSGNVGRLFYPKYLLKLNWEMVEGDTKVTNSYNKKKDIYFLNQAKFRFTQTDIERGYILVRLKGTPHKNSRSSETSKIYKIYWK